MVLPSDNRNSLMAWPLALLTRLIVAMPGTVLVLALVVSGASIVLTVGGLDFRTSRLDLLNPNSSYNKLWLEYIEEFDDDDDAILVVEGADQQQIIPVLDELKNTLDRDQEHFQAVLHKFDVSKLRAKGLHYVSNQELKQLEHSVSNITQGDWSSLNVGELATGLTQQLRLEQHRQDGIAKLTKLNDSLLNALDDNPEYESPWHEEYDAVTTRSNVESEYLLINNSKTGGKLGLVLLQLKEGSGKEFAQNSGAIDRLRAIMAAVRERHPGVTIGLTGLPVMENDEMRASQNGMVLASLISLLGVSLLFIAGFGCLRHPIITVFVLLLGMAMSFGFVTLVVGHLNILSVSFGVILIGLGIDFGIHYVARYQFLHQTISDPAEALVETARSVGPGILTGGLTTSLAFLTAALTEFTGVAELGIIAGGGIAICLFAMLFILPACIFLADRKRGAESPPQPLAVDSWINPLLQRPLATLGMISIVAITATVSLSFGWVPYDHNLLNLQPVGVESVDLERKLINDTDQSAWFAISISDNREELREREERFKKLPSVQFTRSLVSRLPEDDSNRTPTIKRIGEKLPRLPERAPHIPVVTPDALGQQLRVAQSLLTGTDAKDINARQQVIQLRDRLRRLTPQECEQRIGKLQNHMAGELLTRLHSLSGMASPEPPLFSDFPEELATRFVGKNDRHLLQIYAKGDIWNMQDLETFVTDVKSIDPNATGQPLQTYYASRQMQTSYVHAAIYAVLAVSIVLMLDFSSVRYTLLAMLPVAVGALLLFGLMKLFEIPFNPANMIVLPLILGIGIDDGVHVVHDLREQRGRFRLSSSTATAIILTSLTTMVGFGSLMTAGHQGLQSLGRVLTLGVSCCLLTSLLMLPALLIWFTRGEEDCSESPTEVDETEDALLLEEV